MTNLSPAFSTGVIPDWFHGVIPRKTAEELLMAKPRGYFLIRVGESRPGYTLSYRGQDHCRHFMIDVMEDGGYIIVGEKRCHQSLQDLVDFHRRTPIVPYTEVLTAACGKDDKTNYAELHFPQRHPGNVPSLQPNISLLPSTSGLVPPEEVPPALPYRSDLPRTQVQDSHVTSSYPDIPVPMPRNRYRADGPQPSRSPEVSVWNFVPQLKQNLAAVSLPPYPSTPPPTDDQVGISTDTGTKLAAKPLPVSNLKILNKIFQAKKSRWQELGDSESTENEYGQVTEERPVGGPRGLRTHPQIPQEYLPPPPFAPGH